MERNIRRKMFYFLFNSNDKFCSRNYFFVSTIFFLLHFLEYNFLWHVFFPSLSKILARDRSKKYRNLIIKKMEFNADKSSAKIILFYLEFERQNVALEIIF